MAITEANNISDTAWFANCCSTTHIIYDVNDLIDFKPWREPED